jgi:hypothetical protein
VLDLPSAVDGHPEPHVRPELLGSAVRHDGPVAKKGQRLGSWVLTDFIAAGGNADVWRARHDDGRNAAVKILQRSNAGSEAYRRFRDEIAVLRRLGAVSGVLPLLDAHLPTAPSPSDLAWLAMPEAVGLRAALGEAPPLHEVIDAVLGIGRTLCRLAGLGVFHRDIKPANLYRLNNEWMIGDFGLVEYPEKEALTKTDRRFGPIYFVPPEVLENPSAAEGGPLDVYSLAKTLWVLTSGRQWPLGGEHHLGAPEFSLATYSDDGRARLLDPLLYAATRTSPSSRPTMDAFVQQLTAWLTPVTTETHELDLSELQRRMEAHHAPAVASREETGRRYRTLNDAIATMKASALDEINSRLHALIPESGDYNQTDILLRTGSLSVDVEYSLCWASHRVADGGETQGLGPIQFYAAIAGGLRSDDRLILAAGYVIVENHARDDVWHDERIVMAGTADEEHALAALRDGLNANLANAVQGVLRRLDERRSRVPS